MTSHTNLYFWFKLKLKLQNTSNKDTFHCISDELSLVDALISIIITSFQYLLSAAAYILLKKHKSFKQENLQQKQITICWKQFLIE